VWRSLHVCNFFETTSLEKGKKFVGDAVKTHHVRREMAIISVKY